MSAHVAVVTDSAASIPEVVARRWGVSVVPLQIIADGEARAEGVSVKPGQVLAELEAGVAVTTSQPSVGAFTEAYQAAADAGATAIVSVHISGKMSGTVNGAALAAQDSPVPVTVVDSRTLAMATGFAALSAASLARGGATADEVAAEARRAADSSICVFTVDTLEFLKRGGRVSGPLAALGEALSIRPVLEIREGEVELVERVRTTIKARAAVSRIAEAHIEELDRPGLAIMGLGAQDYADDAAREIEGRHAKIVMTVRTPVSAVLAVHTGPGTLAAAVVDLPRQLH